MAGNRAAIYCRVSTTKQAKEEHYSLSYQAGRTQSHCAEHNYIIVQELTEVHTGAELDERPEMTTLRQMIRKREVDIVVLIRLDRLARDQIHQSVLIYEAEKYGVRIELTDEEPYEDTAMGRFMRSVKGFVNEIERHTIKERTTSGMRQRVKKGHMIPGPHPLYGYQFGDEKRTHYIVHPRTSQVVIRIFQDLAAGKTMRSIAFSLRQEGIPSPMDQHRLDRGLASTGTPWTTTAIYNIAHHPAYCGLHAAYRWSASRKARAEQDGETDLVSGTSISTVRKLRQNAHAQHVVLPHAAPAIVSEATFAQVQKRLRFNQAASRRRMDFPENALLRGGFMRCGRCGYVMGLHRQKKKAKDRPATGFYGYRCYHSRRDFEGGGGSCPGGTIILVEDVDQEVWSKVVIRLRNHAELFDQARKRVSVKGREEGIEALEKLIADYDRAQINLGKAIQRLQTEDDTGDDGPATVLMRQLKDIGTERRRAVEEKRRLEELQRNTTIVYEGLLRAEVWCRSISEQLDELTYEERRAVLYGINLRVYAFRAEDPIRCLILYGNLGDPVELLEDEDEDPDIREWKQERLDQIRIWEQKFSVTNVRNTIYPCGQ